MKLTDEEQQCRSQAKCLGPIQCEMTGECLRLRFGYRAGALAMRKRAAKVCEPIVEREWKSGDVDHNEIPWSLTCVHAIRAIEVDDE